MINEKNFFSENKKINASTTASLVNLKAELYKRKQDAIKSKSSNKNAEFEIINATKSISNSKWNRKAVQLDEKIRDSIRNKKAENSLKNKVNKEEEQLEKELQKSKENMIRKTKLYEEKMKSAYDSLKNKEELKDEDDNLIDFERKVIDAWKVGLLEDNQFNRSDKDEATLDQDELVEYVDSFGRTRTCKRKELSKIEKINEQVLLRRKLDRDLTKDEDDKTSKSSAYPDLYSNFTKSTETDDESDDESHYQRVSKDEIREHGTSYYQFSLDKEKRKEQMENLDELRKQTVQQRKKADQLMDKRNKAMKERLLKLAKRKGLVNDSDDDEKINVDRYIASGPKKEDDGIEQDIDYSIDVKERKLREWDMDKNEFTSGSSFFIDKKGESSRSNKLDKESNDNSSDEELSKFNPEFAPPANLYDDSKRKRFKSQVAGNEEIEDKVDEFLKFTMNQFK